MSIAQWKPKRWTVVALGVCAALFLIGALTDSAKPQVRFLRFEAADYTTIPYAPVIVPIYEIRNKTSSPYFYVAEGIGETPVPVAHVLETDGEGISVPMRYQVSDEYCTGLPLKRIDPGETREVSGAFFGVGERAFRAGVMLWPVARIERQRAVADTQILANALGCWEFASRRLFPNKDFSWSNWVALPLELQSIRKDNPIPIKSHRNWLPQ